MKETIALLQRLTKDELQDWKNNSEQFPQKLIDFLEQLKKDWQGLVVQGGNSEQEVLNLHYKLVDIVDKSLIQDGSYIEKLLLIYDLIDKFDLDDSSPYCKSGKEASNLTHLSVNIQNFEAIAKEETRKTESFIEAIQTECNSCLDDLKIQLNSALNEFFSTDTNKILKKHYLKVVGSRASADFDFEKALSAKQFSINFPKKIKTMLESYKAVNELNSIIMMSDNPTEKWEKFKHKFNDSKIQKALHADPNPVVIKFARTVSNYLAELIPEKIIRTINKFYPFIKKTEGTPGKRLTKRMREFEDKHDSKKNR